MLTTEIITIDTINNQQQLQDLKHFLAKKKIGYQSTVRVDFSQKKVKKTVKPWQVDYFADYHLAIQDQEREAEAQEIENEPVEELDQINEG